MMITNSGSQRFDIYKGPFTKNDQLTASPFADLFLFVEGVQAGDANKVLQTLNKGGSANKRRDSEKEAEEYAKGYVGKRFMNWLAEMDDRRGLERRYKNLTLGYVTEDVNHTFVLSSPLWY
jgi:hypothetical protein